MWRLSLAAADSSVVLRESWCHWVVVVVGRRLSYLLEARLGHGCLWPQRRFGELGRTWAVADSSFAPSTAGLRGRLVTDDEVADVMDKLTHGDSIVKTSCCWSRSAIDSGFRLAQGSNQTKRRKKGK